MSMFRDPQVQRAYDRTGYAVVPFLDGDEVERLNRTWAALDEAVHARPFSASIMSGDPAYRRAVNEAIGEVFARRLNEIMIDYRFSFGSFVAKLAGSTGRLPVHQDPQFVEEPRHEAVNFWVPLVDVDTRNACLRVMPGSHRLNRGPRGTSRAFPYPDLIELVEAQYLVDVPMRAGEACLTSHRTFHGSGPNLAAQHRVVAAAIVVPADAEMRYLYQGAGTPPGTIDVFAVDDGFFRRHVFGAPPPGLPLLERIPARVDPLTREQLARAFADSTARALV
ncbi:MAG TPA: phytanoyl-CoA dioxygenase family protein [Candidatus Sulfotelmatobacter sp.]|nr:phytanoyl-CoA dioxygenase family protein [Candidatus Sulfotelmatobacter sp.]